MSKLDDLRVAEAKLKQAEQAMRAGVWLIQQSCLLQRVADDLIGEANVLLKAD